MLRPSFLRFFAAILLSLSPPSSSFISANKVPTASSLDQRKAFFAANNRGGSILARNKNRGLGQMNTALEDGAFEDPSSPLSSSSSTTDASAVDTSSSRLRKRERLMNSILSGMNELSKLRREDVITASVGVAALAVAIYYRKTWAPFFSKDNIQSKTLELLGQLRPTDSAPLSAWTKALSIYAAGMAFWETLGLSTIPVETAAGMVFGWPGFLASAIGKLIGACFAFALGRYVFAAPARTRLLNSDTALWKILLQPPEPELVKTTPYDNAQTLVQSAMDDEAATSRQPGHAPLTTALFIKNSCFPEFMKNIGSSLVPAVRWRHFMLATMIHGWVWSAMWTWLGVETSASLATEAAAAAWKAKAAVVVAGAAGLVLSPLLMAWWIRDLTRQAEEYEQTDACR